MVSRVVVVLLAFFLLPVVAAERVFSEDFDRANCGGDCWGENWTYQNGARGNFLIVNGVGFVDDFIAMGQTGDPGALSTNIVETYARYFNMSFDWYLTNSTMDSRIDIDNSSLDRITTIRALSGSLTVLNATGYQVLTPVSVGHWYNVSVRLNWSSNTVDVYLNDSLVGVGIVPYNAVSDALGRIKFSSQGSNLESDHRVDNITIDASDLSFGLSSVVFSGNQTFNGSNWVRNLSFTAGYTCADFASATLDERINGSLNRQLPLVCDNTNRSISNSYVHGFEGSFNHTLVLNVSYNELSNNYSTGEFEFFSDLNDPEIVLLEFNLTNGFGVDVAEASLKCNDSLAQVLFYNMSLNGSTLFRGNHSPLTIQTNETDPLDGVNGLFGECRDFFGGVNDTLDTVVYSQTITLIDEVDNGAFDVTNLSRVRVYFDDNSSYHDFQVSGDANVTFTAVNEDKLRFELKPLGGSLVTRYIDVSLTSDPMRVCANKDDVQHYEQIIISASEKPVRLVSVFANCLVAADYTRFAYQDAFSLRAYTIERAYTLFTQEADGSEVVLASLDGSVASYINLDQLEFALAGYNLNILADALSFEELSNTTMGIYYTNVRNDNTAVRVEIERLGTGDVVFNSSSFANPNNFTIVFDVSTLSPAVNDSELFQVHVLRTADFGSQSIKRYFNMAGDTGVISAGFAMVLAVLLTVFGLTFTVARTTFSWFGIIITLGAIATLSFAVSTWYTTLFLVINVILLVYFAIILAGKNFATVA